MEDDVQKRKEQSYTFYMLMSNKSFKRFIDINMLLIF